MKTAVDDWTATVTKLEELADDARTTMVARSNKADWTGANASVTKPFIGKTAKEFDDAAKAAKGVKQILEDGYNAFKKAQDDLKAIVETDAPAQNLVVGTTGRVAAKNPISQTHAARHDPDFETLVRNERNAVQALQKRIDAVIEACDEADVAASNALKANITGDKHNFSAPAYDSLDAEEAQRAADLAAKGTDMTNTELQQFNELMTDNRGSATFATAFYEKLGPEKTLVFFGQMAREGYYAGQDDKKRLEQIQALQKSLGLTLATATDPDNKPSLPATWGKELRGFGTQRIPMYQYDHSGPFGYQLLGGILRYGNYDPRFLNPIAEHVVQLHKKDPYMFADSKVMVGPEGSPLNPSGVNGAGFDPVVSVLEALGHSPEAAKQFFSAEPTVYDENGKEVKNGTLDLGKGEDGKAIANYLDYFTDKGYDFFPDIVGHHPDDAKKSADYLPDALGHALEAATLGHAWDDPSPTLDRDATSARIMEDVVRTVGVDAELVKRMEPLADSLGTMGAGYIDDVNWALSDNSPESIFAPKDNASTHAKFGLTDIRQFMSTVGQYPDAYASVSTADRIYTMSMLEAQVGPDGQIKEGAAREVVRTGAEVQGLLDQARADQVRAEGAHKDEEFNKALEERSAWVKFGTTAAVSAGVAFLPATVAGAGAAAILVPLAVDTGTGAINEGIGQVIGDWVETEKKNNDSKEDVQEQLRQIYRTGEHNANAPVRQFLLQHGIESETPFAQDLTESVIIGHNSGKRREDEQGNLPQVGD
ncbi:hypothetical protein CUT44_16050 [Streptomyces carminius]|uniref:AG2 protein n=2 Tax=Streptomyces carminius TaxID=2665496 RepID=A0A2M8LY33_9ACTN|nr:hypothetical protein [Streptomyces carminius]PJE96845.1 hypothetical protein CUT44_16050 [Streptomyces carminius]